ncbi:hypothetical protein RB595_009031 [Gaeumannomyces hyphopodioides]
MRIARAAQTVCTLGVCTDIGSELARHLQVNTTQLDLCAPGNFEAWVCDGWRQDHKLRPEQGRMSNDNLLQDRSDNIISTYLNGTKPPIDTPADVESFAKAKAAYSACMNVDAIQNVGVAPIRAMLDEVAALYPVDGKETPLQDVLLYLQKLGISPFIGIGPGRDDKFPLVRLVAVFPKSQLTLSTNFYTDNKTMASYQSAMSKVFAAILPSADARAKADQLANQVVDFEKAVSAITPPFIDLFDVNKYYNIMSLEETDKLAPSLGMKHVISTLSPPDFKNDRLLTSFPEFIPKVEAIVNTTSKETIQAYLSWNVVNQFYRYVTAPEIEPLRVFTNELQGRDPTAFPARWRTCLNEVSGINGLGWILGRFYANDYFSGNSLLLMQSIVAYMKTQYANSIKSLTWLDGPVRDYALKKLDAVGTLLGFPEKLPVNVSDAESVRAFYAPLKIDDSYFNNTIATVQFSNALPWDQLNTPYDRDVFEMTPQTVNAYNSPNSNLIAFPAAILQTPYFHKDLPAYMNFAVTGFTVGHEISHSFDNNGRSFGADGAYGDSWWTNRTNAEYAARSQCFIDQYANFSVPNTDGTPLHLNGEQTLAENIADAGGVDTGFLAWKQYVTEKAPGGVDATLPGLEAYSHEQMYFIAYANGWCGAARPNALISQVFSDSHSPAQFRVTGPLMNSKYFRETFGCASKEPTCKIW